MTLIHAFGESKTAADWARSKRAGLGTTAPLIRSRIFSGMTPERAIGTNNVGKKTDVIGVAHAKSMYLYGYPIAEIVTVSGLPKWQVYEMKWWENTGLSLPPDPDKYTIYREGSTWNMHVRRGIVKVVYEYSVIYESDNLKDGISGAIALGWNADALR